MNDDLLSLHRADRDERVNQPKANTPEYIAMRSRDFERRQRVKEIVAADELHAAEDYPKRISRPGNQCGDPCQADVSLPEDLAAPIDLISYVSLNKACI